MHGFGSMKNSSIRIGTSAFTGAGELGTFYPAGVKAADYLRYYSSQFQTVEIDSTFYGTVSAATVKSWYEDNAGGFYLRDESSPKLEKRVRRAIKRTRCRPCE